MLACVQSYIAGERMDTSSLTPHENEWLKFVWTESQIGKPKQKIRIVDARVTKMDMKNRLKVLVGEIESGNDNPYLLTEMKALMLQMRAKNWLLPGDHDTLDKFIKLSE